MDRSFNRQLVNGNLVFARSERQACTWRRPPARAGAELAARTAVHRLLGRRPARQSWTACRTAASPASSTAGASAGHRRPVPSPLGTSP